MAYDCLLSSRYVDCIIDNARYEWWVWVSIGVRTFRVWVEDWGVNEMVSCDHSFTFE